jgi:hypothetical protein
VFIFEGMGLNIPIRNEIAVLPADSPRKLRTEFTWWECSVSGYYWMYNISKTPSAMTDHIKECKSCQKKRAIGCVFGWDDEKVLC